MNVDKHLWILHYMEVEIIHVSSGSLWSIFGIWIMIWLIDWLFVVLRPAQEYFIYIWRRHHRRWRAAKFRPMLVAQGLWAGRDLYRPTPAVTWEPVFPVSFEGLTHSVAFYDTQGGVEDLF
jgi:hypothetical protein